MKIQEVKITGFKSFVETVNFPIENGLTGIIGPNGCGKSNILESLRWVMGATSAKALRGAEMDDIIFAGTDKRPPRDIAEVVLKIDNSQGRAPAPFNHAPILEISRRIRRGLGSTFKINGKEVRAKDIQLLFADASSGANSPALVKQGQVSELINAKPENRRKVLEEASGISGLQARRHEAQIKLNATQSNLERVAQILINIEEQINSLKKQANRAQKYRALASQIRGYEMFITLHRHQKFVLTIDEAQKKLNILQNKSADLTIIINENQKHINLIELDIPKSREEFAIADAVLRRLEAKAQVFDKELDEVKDKQAQNHANLERTKANILREEELLQDAIDSIKLLENHLKELNINHDFCDEISKLKDDAANLKSQLLKHESNQSELLNNKSIIENNIKQKEREKENLIAQKENIENIINHENSNIENLQKNIIEIAILEIKKNEILALKQAQQAAFNDSETIRAQIIELEESENSIKSKTSLAETEIIKIKAQIKGIQSFLNSNKDSKDSVINFINVKKNYEKAVAAAFGDDLLAHLEQGDIYWGGAEDIDISWPKELGKIDALMDFVEAPNQLMPRLKSIAIIDKSIFEKGILPPIGARFVTIEGDLIRWDGFIRSKNTPNSSAIKFEQQNQLAELENALPNLQEIYNEHKKSLEKIRINIKSLIDKSNQSQKNMQNLISSITIAEREFINLENNNIKIQSQINNAKEIIIINSDKLEIINDAISQSLEFYNSDNNNELTQNTQLLAKILLEINDIRNQYNEIVSQYSLLERQSNNIQNQLTQNQQQIIAWKNRELSASKRLQELNKEIVNLELEKENLKDLPNNIAQLRKSNFDDIAPAEKRRANASDNLAKIEAIIREKNSLLKTYEANYSEISGEIISIEAQILSLKERLQELTDEIFQKFECDTPQLKINAQKELGNLFENLDIEKAQSRLNRASQDRESLGGVNLRADEELIEQTQRYDKLNNESHDLSKAIKKLQNAINEINDEGRERLIRAFEVVNRHFCDLFTTLFEGGEAHLALTETEDPLGGGLEVYACPPGKRLQTMSLMSGGEQALTAMALIFAVFLSNPAPLSVLDEIDAPLDDANVDRFCRLMDEMRKKTETKFIVITHHPITMARMDRLFGITMSERGVSQLVAVDLNTQKLG